MDKKVKCTSRTYSQRHIMDRHWKDMENTRWNRSDQADIAFRRKPFYRLNEMNK